MLGCRIQRRFAPHQSGGATPPRFNEDRSNAGTIRYSAPDVRVISHEDQLRLNLQVGDGWGKRAATCTPSLPYDRDLVGRLSTLPICRTGTLALYGPTHQCYLPLVLRRF
jgi:hypothetical protein